eukprot:CFRG2090T1
MVSTRNVRRPSLSSTSPASHVQGVRKTPTKNPVVSSAHAKASATKSMSASKTMSAARTPRTRSRKNLPPTPVDDIVDNAIEQQSSIVDPPQQTPMKSLVFDGEGDEFATPVEVIDKSQFREPTPVRGSAKQSKNPQSTPTSSARHSAHSTPSNNKSPKFFSAQSTPLIDSSETSSRSKSARSTPGKSKTPTSSVDNVTTQATSALSISEENEENIEDNLNESDSPVEEAAKSSSTDEETKPKLNTLVAKSKKIVFGDDDDFDPSVILPKTVEAIEEVEDDEDEMPESVGFKSAQQMAEETEEARISAVEEAKARQESELRKRKERIEDQRLKKDAKVQARLPLDFLKSMATEIEEEAMEENIPREESEEPERKRRKEGKKTKFVYDNVMGQSVIQNGAFTIAVADQVSGKKTKGHRGGKITDEVKDFKKKMLEQRNNRIAYGASSAGHKRQGRPSRLFAK